MPEASLNGYLTLPLSTDIVSRNNYRVPLEEIDAIFADHIGLGGTTRHPAATTGTAGFMSASDKTTLGNLSTEITNARSSAKLGAFANVDARLESVEARAIPPATVVVAASNSTRKETADYICTGANDQVQIQAAIDALPAGGGRVLLMAGVYHLGVPDDPGVANAVSINGRDSVTLQGQGPSTLLTIDEPVGAEDRGIYVNNYRHIAIRDLCIQKAGTGGGFSAVYVDDAGANQDRFTMHNVFIRMGGYAVGVTVKGDRAIVSNCNIDAETGVRVYGKYAVISSNTFDTTTASIIAEAAALYPVINGNMCRLAYASSVADRYNIRIDTTGAAVNGNSAIATLGVGGGFTDYGIRLAATSVKCAVIGNISVGGVSDAGTGNEVVHNITP